MKNKIGKTGIFREGKLNQQDEGGINIAIFEEKGKVIINFGTQLRWLGMTPSEAIAIADGIRERAEKLIADAEEVIN